jgi:hypothetical protein
LLGEPAGETIRTAVELMEHLNAETDKASQSASYRMDETSQNNRDARTSISQPPSQQPSRRSSFHAHESMVYMIRSNADQEVAVALLPNEVLDSQV